MNRIVDKFQVRDRQTFMKFLDLLCDDYRENAEIWENKTLYDFLSAMSAFTQDIQGYYDNRNLEVNADKPDWSTFADILKGAKVYE